MPVEYNDSHIETELTQPKREGALLAQQLENLASNLYIRIREGNLDNLREIDSIIIVGSSGAGKSTIVDHMREFSKKEGLELFDYPKRVVTRPQRENDNTLENEFATDESDFQEKTSGGIRWQRQMDLEGNRTEQYGFRPAKPNSIPVYSANNAILREYANLESTNDNFLDNALIILVYADDETRSERLNERSPDLVNQKPEEVAMRLGDRAISEYPKAHILIRNHEHFEDTAKSTAEYILEAIKQVKEQSGK